MFATVVLPLLGVSVVVGALCVPRVPAIALALFSGVACGVVGYATNIGDGRSGLPFIVASWASAGVLAGGVVGLVLRRPHVSRSSLGWSAFWLLLASPVVAAVIGGLLTRVCPLYVSQSGLCDYDEADQLGGWVGGIVVIAGLDLVVLAILLLASAKRVDRRWEEERDDGS